MNESNSSSQSLGKSKTESVIPESKITEAKGSTDSNKNSTRGEGVETTLSTDLKSATSSNQPEPGATLEAAGTPTVVPGYQIPHEVAILLNDISTQSPVGKDIENGKDQANFVLFMNLEKEINKYGHNDYEQCLKWGQQILQESSKHLRVTMWLCIAWFRTEDLNGFKNGLVLITELIKKYGEKLFPVKADQKISSIHLLNNDSRIKLLAKTEIDLERAKLIIEINTIYNEFLTLCLNLFPENPPKLNFITELIQEKVKIAESILSKSSQPQIKTKDREDVYETVRSGEIGTTRTGQATITSEITKEKDAGILIKKAIQFYFEEESNGKKRRKVPLDASVYGLSRVLRWSRLNLPNHTNNITQIEPPNQPKHNLIQNLVQRQDFDTLIPEIEISFLNREDFLYWLDAQKFVVQALEQKGGGYADAANEIKVHLARLINKVPGLLNLIFKDKKTPFASKEMMSWFEDEVRPLSGSGKVQQKILPPILGEDYEPINQFYEKVCTELPNNFETNVKEMQNAIVGDTRLKGKFLRLLNLANYCYAAKQYGLARVLFNQLMDKIDEYKITEWERALCVAVWQSMYMNNLKLLASDLKVGQKEAIEQQQVDLFDRIGKYDSVRALNLSIIK